MSPENFISNNPHFCKSALARYTPEDFIALVKKHGIKYYEKTLGQLFCRERSHLIVEMLLKECEKAGVEILADCSVKTVAQPSRRLSSVHPAHSPPLTERAQIVQTRDDKRELRISKSCHRDRRTFFPKDRCQRLWLRYRQAIWYKTHRDTSIACSAYIKKRKRLFKTRGHFN